MTYKDQKDTGQRKHRHRHKHDRDKRGHRRHHHHHHRGFSEADSLESRVRTGLQTLEEEKKAIFDISQELKEDQVLRTLDLKDRDTIQSMLYNFTYPFLLFPEFFLFGGGGEGLQRGRETFDF